MCGLLGGCGYAVCTESVGAFEDCRFNAFGTFGGDAVCGGDVYNFAYRGDWSGEIVMSGFKGFVAAFCTVCVVFGGVQLIIPKGAFSKSVRYILGLVFLSSLLAVMLSVKRFSPQFNYYTDSARDTGTMSKAAITSVFEQALTSNNINFSKIEVCTDKTDSNSIIITEVTVYSSDSEARITELIGFSDSYEVKVVNE